MRRSSSKKLKMNVDLVLRGCRLASVPRPIANSLAVGVQVEPADSCPRVTKRPSDQSRGFSARNVSPSTAYGHDHDLAVGWRRTVRAVVRDHVGIACRRRSRSATCRPAPETAGRTLRLRPDSFDSYASHRPSGENIGSRSLNGAVQEHGGLAGLPARRLVALHRQDHQVRARLRHAAPRTPGTCRSGATRRDADCSCSSSGAARRRCRRRAANRGWTSTCPARTDAKTIRRPSGVHTGFSSRPGRTSGASGCRAPTRRPTRPTACRRRSAGRAGGHRARSGDCSSSPASARSGVVFPVAIHPVKRQLVAGALPRQIHQRAVARHRELRAARARFDVTPSSTGTGGPVTSSRSRSNGAAKSVPSWR